MTTSFQLEPELALTVLENLPAAVLISDEAEQILWCNHRFAELTELTPSEVLNRQRGDLIAATLSEVEEQSDTYLSNRIGQRIHWYRHQRMPLQGNNCSLTADIYLDISHEAELQNRFDELSERIGQLTTTDAISGLLNQRAMMQSLEPLVSRSRRYENPLSVIAIELLNFNLLAERHGMDTANKAVIAISHLLKDQLRWADIIARINDTRIIIILPETEQVDALYLANKILSKVSELEVKDNNNVSMQIDTCYSISSWKKGNDSRLLLNRTYHALEKAIVNGSHSIVEG